MTQITEFEVRKRAELALTRPGINIQPVDAQQVAEAHGIKTWFVDFTNEDPEHTAQRVAAFYDHDEQAIYVNKAVSGVEKNHLIAIELGKALLFPHWSAGDDYEISRRDAEANTQEAHLAQIFARALLVLPKMLAPILRVRTYPEVAKLCVIPWSEFKKEIPLIEAARATLV